MSLVIRKLGNKNFFHYFSIGGTAFEYSASDLTIIIDNNKAKLRSLTGRPIALKDGYTVNQITIFDDSTGGSAETFATFILLTQRLIDLGYPAYYQDGQIILGDLISGDANNALVLGSDGKLYVANLSGNFIPLSGTTEGNPVAGDIEFYSSVEDVSYYLKFNSSGNFGIEDSEGNYISTQIIFLNDGNNTRTLLSDVGFSLNSNNSLFKGFFGNNYYGANYDDNTYVQKKYVDDAIAENSPIVREKITITGSAFRTLNSSPVTLIPAPGAGKAVIISSIFIFFDFGTVQADYIAPGYSITGLGGSGTIGDLNAGFDITFVIASNLNNNVQPNQPVILRNLVGDATVGDSTLNVYITYEIITL